MSGMEETHPVVPESRNLKTYAERYSAGGALLEACPRQSHAGWKAPANRRHPLELLLVSEKERIPDLLPLRHGHMVRSAFTFYRGAALTMAADLAHTPSTGVYVQCCGDAKELRALLHLSPNATEFALVSAPLPSNDTEVAVMTRSISGMIQSMAAQVEVPSEHVVQHRALPGVEAGHELPGIVPMIRIHRSKPDDSFVSVHYRDTWFWIDDGDLPSKMLLVRLMQLSTMIDTGPGENLPVVTLPSR